VPSALQVVLALGHLLAGAGKEPSIRTLCSSNTHPVFRLDLPSINPERGGLMSGLSMETGLPKHVSSPFFIKMSCQNE
jgi:hypothetical protein